MKRPLKTDNIEIYDKSASNAEELNVRWSFGDICISSSFPELAIFEEIPSECLNKIGILIGILNLLERYLQCCYGNVDKHEILVIITSMYRSEALNSTVNGSKTSQHMELEAVDFTLANSSLLEMAFEFIKNVIGMYSDLILYQDKVTNQFTQIHLGLWRHDKKPNARIVRR